MTASPPPGHGGHGHPDDAQRLVTRCAELELRPARNGDADAGRNIDHKPYPILLANQSPRPQEVPDLVDRTVDRGFSTRSPAPARSAPCCRARCAAEFGTSDPSGATDVGLGQAGASSRMLGMCRSFSPGARGPSEESRQRDTKRIKGYGRAVLRLSVVIRCPASQPSASPVPGQQAGRRSGCASARDSRPGLCRLTSRYHRARDRSPAS